MHHEDEILFQQSYDERERSHTPPGLFGVGYAYPPPEEIMMAPHYGTSPPHTQSQTQVYRAVTAAEAYPEYLVPTTVPVTLPSLSHFSDAIKRDSGYGEEVAPYMNYGYMPGMDVSAPAPYDHSNPHVSSSSRHQPHPYPVPPPTHPSLPRLHTSFGSRNPQPRKH
jgi:hypothetical protein